MAVSQERIEAAQNSWWLDACYASLCDAYQRKNDMILGVPATELCSHDWCKGVRDVMSRIYAHALEPVEG